MAIPGIVLSGGIVLPGGIDGHLRADSSKSGAIVWDVDTKRQSNTVNGVSGQSGSPGGVQWGSAVDADNIYVTVLNVVVEVVPKGTAGRTNPHTAKEISDWTRRQGLAIRAQAGDRRGGLTVARSTGRALLSWRNAVRQLRYTKFGTTPGNVLLAFSVDGK